MKIKDWENPTRREMKQDLAELYIDSELIPLIKRSSQKSLVIIATAIVEKMTSNSVFSLAESVSKKLQELHPPIKEIENG